MNNNNIRELRKKLKLPSVLGRKNKKVKVCKKCAEINPIDRVSCNWCGYGEFE